MSFVVPASSSGGSGTVTTGSSEGAGQAVYDSTNSTATNLVFKSLTSTDASATLTHTGTTVNVSVPNTSPLTTKGDLYGYSSVNARIPVGSNGNVLTADSTQTLGLKWAASAGGGGIPWANPAAGSFLSIYNCFLPNTPPVYTPSGGTITTGTLYYMPLLVPYSLTVTTIQVNVGTAAAGQTIVMGLYVSDVANSIPAGAGPIANSNSGNISIASTGTVQYTFGTPITLAAGLYWTAISVSGGTGIIDIASHTTAGTCSLTVGASIATPLTTGSSLYSYSQSFSYSSTLPAVAGGINFSQDTHAYGISLSVQ